MSFAHNKGNNDRKPQQVYTNEFIKAPNIMILDGEGKNLGVFPRHKALEMGKEAGLDLVQLSYDRDKMLSTVKLIDYGKYMYQKSKDEKEKKKKQTNKEQKEIKIKYNIGENDLEMKVNHAIKFLQDGHSVKVSIRLRGREKIYSQKAIEKLEHAVEKLEPYTKFKDPKPKEFAGGYSITLFAK